MTASGDYQITGSNVPVYTRKGPDGLEVWFAFRGLCGRFREGETLFSAASGLPASFASKGYKGSNEPVALVQAERELIGFREVGRYNVYTSEDGRAFSCIRSDLDDNPQGPTLVIEPIQVPEHLDFRS